MVAVLKQLPLDTVYCRVRSCKYLMAFWPHYPWLSELSSEHSYVLVTNRRYSHRGAQVWPLVSVRACVWPSQQWIREKRNECGLFCDLWARLVKRVLRLWLQTPSHSYSSPEKDATTNETERKRNATLCCSVWVFVCFPPRPQAIIDPSSFSPTSPAHFPGQCH